MKEEPKSFHEQATKEIITNTEYCCAHCGENNWSLCIGHSSNGQTLLNVYCSNEKCQAERSKELDLQEDEHLIWEQFDITNQGYDNLDDEDGHGPN